MFSLDSGIVIKIGHPQTGDPSRIFYKKKCKTIFINCFILHYDWSKIDRIIMNYLEFKLLKNFKTTMKKSYILYNFEKIIRITEIDEANLQYFIRLFKKKKSVKK